MQTRVFIAAVLGMSMLNCFAESASGFKTANEFFQQNQYPGDTKQQEKLKSLSAEKQQIPAKSQQNSDVNQKPSMIDYCRTHTC